MRSIIGISELHESLEYWSTGCLGSGLGLDANTDQLEAMYVDDATHGFLHVTPRFVVGAAGWILPTDGSCCMCTWAIAPFWLLAKKSGAQSGVKRPWCKGVEERVAGSMRHSYCNFHLEDGVRA